MSGACSCGEAGQHVVARRTTADDVRVVMWDDGALTGPLGFALPGVPVVRPRSAAARARALDAGWMVLGDVCLYDADEVPALYEACRWAATRELSIGAARERLGRAPVLRPVWTVTRADRDGKPTERVWCLPRLRWPGLVVWDNVSHGRGGRYEIVRRIHGSEDTYETTGLRFSTLAALSAHLLSEAA